MTEDDGSDRKFSYHPTTVAEAVARLRRDLSAEQLAQLAGRSEEDLIWEHFGICSGIRNSYGLWAEDSPLLRASGKEHPDDASAVILHVLWSELRQERGRS